VEYINTGWSGEIPEHGSFAIIVHDSRREMFSWWLVAIKNERCVAGAILLDPADFPAYVRLPPKCDVLYAGKYINVVYSPTLNGRERIWKHGSVVTNHMRWRDASPSMKLDQLTLTHELCIYEEDWSKMTSGMDFAFSTFGVTKCDRDYDMVDMIVDVSKARNSAVIGYYSNVEWVSKIGLEVTVDSNEAAVRSLFARGKYKMITPDMAFDNMDLLYLNDYNCYITSDNRGMDPKFRTSSAVSYPAYSFPVNICAVLAKLDDTITIDYDLELYNNSQVWTTKFITQTLRNVYGVDKVSWVEARRVVAKEMGYTPFDSESVNGVRNNDGKFEALAISGHLTNIILGAHILPVNALFFLETVRSNVKIALYGKEIENEGLMDRMAGAIKAGNIVEYHPDKTTRLWHNYSEYLGAIRAAEILLPFMGVKPNMNLLRNIRNTIDDIADGNPLFLSSDSWPVSDFIRDNPTVVKSFE
jgi:hypothetical protein